MSFGEGNSNASFEQVEPKYFNVKSKTETINTPDKTNALELGTMNLNISRKHPEYPAIVMANELLGGGCALYTSDAADYALRFCLDVCLNIYHKGTDDKLDNYRTNRKAAHYRRTI
mgnify:CR=1 FL=1